MMLHCNLRGVLDLLQLGAAALQIGQHILHTGAVLLLQTVQLIHAALHIVQLVGREVEALPLVLDGGRHIIGLAVQCLYALKELGIVLVQMAHRADGVLRPAQKPQCTVAAVVAVEGIIRLGDGGNELLCVAQQIAAGGKLLLLTGAELRPLQLADLVRQGVHPAGFFRFVHFQRLYFSLDICKVFILFNVCIYKCFQLSKAVQKQQMLLLVQKLLPIVHTLKSIKTLQTSGVMPSASGTEASTPENTALTKALSIPVRISSRLARCPSTAPRASMTNNVRAVDKVDLNVLVLGEEGVQAGLDGRDRDGPLRVLDNEHAVLLCGDERIEVCALGLRRVVRNICLAAHIAKNDLFRGVVFDGVLPRKTFSMGEAHEKRYYLEAKAIVK